ncbi:MAG: hypothetical protein HOP29_03855 [Phycisphaerales bacterium]|nr:hypothetical protein [Phycisphaerales bacterium]
MSGLFKRPTIEAGFEFGEGPVAVLVDDFQEQCYWPGATHLLAEKVVQALLDQNVAKIVIPASHMHQLRQGDPDFDEKSAAAVGRLVNADQLLLLEIRSFDATETPTEASAAARMSVAAKVINVLENNDRAKVRLWPRSHEGEVIEADITAAAITRAKSREAILDELTKALAERVVRRFYDRPMEDFEKG